jgi:hypothetical protein
MNTPATLRLFNIFVLTARGVVPCGTEQATNAADAIARAFGLARRPSLRHDGPHGSGYYVRGRWMTASAETIAPTVAPCRLCGERHAVTAADRTGDRGETLPDAEAMLTAHYRLAIAATSAGPFALHGRAV